MCYMKKLTVFIALIAFFGLSLLNAQTRTVTGTVTSSEDGMGIPGVNVIVKGTTVGVATDFDGKYTINVPEGKTILTYDALGFATQEVTITGSVINVVLQSSNIALDEVVVVGYGTKKKNALTSSVTTVKAAKLEQVPMPSVEQVLQGNVAGLTSVSTTGQPGAAQEIRIRGIGSINASSSPLYVIDGVPVVSGDYSRNSTSSNVMAGLSSNDIENISVLKDASATSVYGARGANGVILITTKSGKKGETKFNFDAEYGFNKMAVNGPKSLNSAQWKELSLESVKNRTAYSGYHDGTPEGMQTFLETYFTPKWTDKDTDWSKEILRDFARQQQYNFSMRGGNEKTSFFTSAGYFEQQGIVNNTGYDRLSGLLNLNHRPSDKITFRVSMNASTSDQNTVSSGGTFANPMLSRFFLLPIESPYNEDGTLATDPQGDGSYRMGNGLFNPLYIAKNDFSENKTNKILGNASAAWKPIDGLKIESKFGGDFISIEERSYQNSVHGDGRGRSGSADAYYTRNFNWVWQNMVDYGFNFADDHRIDLKALYESQSNQQWLLNAYAERVATSGLTHLTSFSKPVTASSSASKWGTASAMFNFNYAYKGKYLVDGTFRREGSSVFSDDNKYGNFWSVGLSWNISNEDFIKNIESISSLKLRASYGLNGNAGIGANSYLSQLGYSGSYNDYPVIFYTGIENQALTWEKSAPFNVGLDFGFFNESLTGTIEYYHKTTSDMLLNVPLSYTTGFSSVRRNIGSMVNSGIEFSLSSVNWKTSDFSWTTDFNISKQSNEVTELSKDLSGEYVDIIGGGQRIKVGDHIRTWYMRKWAGVDPDNGDPLWYKNGVDGETTNVYSEAERANQGQSTPNIFGGLTNTIEYKGITLNFQFNYAFGYKVWDTWAYYMQSDGAYLASYSGYESSMNRWQEPGDIADNPKVVIGGNQKSNETSTRQLFDADHIRLRNLSLGYNLPKSFAKKLGLNGINIYARGTNLFTYVFDKDLKFDPETGGNGQLDLALPVMKTISFGLKINL